MPQKNKKTSNTPKLTAEKVFYRGVGVTFASAVIVWATMPNFSNDLSSSAFTFLIAKISILSLVCLSIFGYGIILSYKQKKTKWLVLNVVCLLIVLYFGIALLVASLAASAFSGIQFQIPD